MIKTRGAALITALLVIAIVAAIATALMSRLQIDIERSELNFNADKAYLAAVGVKNWAIAHYDDVYSAAQQKEAARPHWPIVMGQQPLSGGTINGYLENAQGRFNINNLINQDYQPTLAHLIQYVQPQINYQQAMKLAQNVSAWLSPGGSNDAADQKYLQQQPAYRVAHQLMVSSSELRLVDGFNADLYQRLSPYLIALPQVTPIDVNAASEALLIAGGVSANGAAATVNYLKSHSGFSNMDAFKQISQFNYSTDPKTSPLFAVNSEFFYAKANIVLGNVYFVAYYLLQYQQNQHSLEVLRYSQGTL